MLRVELIGFIGLNLLFGLTKKHDVEVSNIWNYSSIDHSDWASVCMSRDRFKNITTHICFDDFDMRMQTVTTDPKFHKMREIFDLFKNNLRDGMEPGSNLCVDEQLYAFRGRCGFKQFIPSKPAKYGIKYWGNVCVFSGYLFDVDIYLGMNI